MQLARGRCVPAIVGDISAQLPLGLLWDVGHKGVLRLWSAHHMVPQLLVLVDVGLCAQLASARFWGRVAVVEEALQAIELAEVQLCWASGTCGYSCWTVYVQEGPFCVLQSSMCIMWHLHSQTMEL